MNEDGGKDLRQPGDGVLRGGERSPRDESIRTNERGPGCRNTECRGEPVVDDAVRLEVQAGEARDSGGRGIEPRSRDWSREQHKRAAKQIERRDPLSALLDPDVGSARSRPAVRLARMLVDSVARLIVARRRHDRGGMIE